MALQAVPNSRSSRDSLTAVLGLLDMLPAGLCQRGQAALLHQQKVLLRVFGSALAVS